MVDLSAPSPSAGALRTLTGISIAHWISHLHMLVLPLLFPILKDQLGVDYVALGFALTIFGVVSAVTQAPIGYLVDHLGARMILLAGILLGGTALILLGLSVSYGSLLACSALLGLANATYHPADYAILAAHMDEERMGRAFSIHSFSGFLGAAMAPAIVHTLTTTFGSNGALIGCGLLAIFIALLLPLLRIPDAAARKEGSGHSSGAKPRIVTTTLIVLTIFFLLLSLSSTGITSFGLVALTKGFGISDVSANTALSAYLATTAAGVLAGGFLADWTTHHGQVAAFCFAVNAVIVVVIALVPLSAPLLILLLALAGFLSGVIAPSRDMLVRNAAPPGATGRAFGIVSTGFNFGAIIGPPLFGWIMDHNAPHWLFGASAIFMLATVALSFFTEPPRVVKES